MLLLINEFIFENNLNSIAEQYRLFKNTTTKECLQTKNKHTNTNMDSLLK